MRRPPLTVIVALLGGAAAAAPTQETADTTLTVEGFLQDDEQFDLWTIVLPLPLQTLGARTFVLPLVGGAGRWSPLRNRYVAAHGRVSRLASGGTPGARRGRARRRSGCAADSSDPHPQRAAARRCAPPASATAAAARWSRGRTARRLGGTLLL